MSNGVDGRLLVVAAAAALALFAFRKKKPGNGNGDPPATQLAVCRSFYSQSLVSDGCILTPTTIAGLTIEQVYANYQIRFRSCFGFVRLPLGPPGSPNGCPLIEEGSRRMSRMVKALR